MNVPENERPIPDAAYRDENAVEMLRVWIAEQGIHCSIRVGMYKESMDVREETAWGVILADVAKHIAMSLEAGYSMNAAESLQLISSSFQNEIENSTSEARGDFVQKQ